jgi:hypothetical protein
MRRWNAWNGRLMDSKAIAHTAIQRVRIRQTMQYAPDEMVELINDILKTAPEGDPSRQRIEELPDLARVSCGCAPSSRRYRAALTAYGLILASSAASVTNDAH